MTTTFAYNDPVIALERFIDKINRALPKRTSDTRGIEFEWDDGTFELSCSTGDHLSLNLIGENEYLYIIHRIAKFNNQETPRLCEVA